MAFVIKYLTGRARLWVTAEWDRQALARSSFQEFSLELHKVFGPPRLGPDVAGGLLEVCQRSCTVSDYAIDFHIKARATGIDLHFVTLFSRALTPI